MKATIYHNPMCGTSRKTLDILRDSGCDVWIHEYLKNPPNRDELARLYAEQGTDWCFDVAVRVAPNRPAAWDLTTVAGVAFARYAREAIDYTTGRRTAES